MRNHLSEGMRNAALCHTKMAGELATLRTMVSSAAEFVLRCLPNKTFRLKVVDESFAEF
jgi:hypothetical protein